MVPLRQAPAAGVWTSLGALIRRRYHPAAQSAAVHGGLPSKNAGMEISEIELGRGYNGNRRLSRIAFLAKGHDSRRSAQSA